MTTPAGPEPSACWRDAITAAALVALDPAGLGGLRIRGAAAAAGFSLLDHFRTLLPEGAPVRRIPAGIADDRLLGGLDLAATLSAGRPVHQRGLLAEAHGGLLVSAGAERMPAGVAGRIAGALDRGAVAAERDGFGALHPARFAVLAFDDAQGDDAPPPSALTERLGLLVDLSALRPSDLAHAPATPDMEAARAQLARVELAEPALRALAEAAAALGVTGLRPLLFACAAARASAALDGRDLANDADLARAARLVLGPRATCAPAAADDDDEDAQEPETNEDGGGASNDEGETGDPRELAERVLAAAAAALPPGLLEAGAAPRSAGAAGRSGATQASPRRGRPVGSRAGRLHDGVRLDLVATLRAAAPWQRLRLRDAGMSEPVSNEPATASPRILVRRDDFRIQRLKERRRALAIFVVDASGSAALHRLAEAKGAVELLLAESYVRRDEAALIAFRGSGAELLLPPTRSLARAKRALAELPGGGGTPLASGIAAAAELADRARRRGDAPTIVLLTDGAANVARDGEGSRARAAEDATAAARALKLLGVPAVLIDVSPRPQSRARDLAAAMAARYVALPMGDAASLARAARG